MSPSGNVEKDCINVLTFCSLKGCSVGYMLIRKAVEHNGYTMCPDLGLNSESAIY